ncbi:MAG: sigma factor-like helix-turn-helix DNA-binding protein [Candidatus Pacebacteria bacterium]|nr:sigma factor-like helix-turn-helix DNA-binding protein [Candidatus Paceibacterota bacterium]
MEFEYKTISEKILKDLPERTKTVIGRRFSLGKKGKGETLEAIGKSYKITRERVRQIEIDGVKRAKKVIESSNFKKDFEAIENFLFEKIKSFGGVKKEDQLLSEVCAPEDKNYVLFLLNLVKSLTRIKEDQNFHAFWAIDKDSVSFAKNTCIEFERKFKEAGNPQLIKDVYEGFSKESEKKCDIDTFLSYLEISKNIIKSVDNKKIGLKDSPEVNPKTVKDKILVILKDNQKPLHFKDITNHIFDLNKELGIRENKNKKLHPQTVHNELIRNEDFILVGRGFYALKDWGYNPGKVKDVIVSILAENGPMSKEGIIDKVSGQRIVKESTIFLSLQNKNIFTKDENGNYKIREA